MVILLIITGPPIHIVGGTRLIMVAGVCRCHLSGSVTLHGGFAGGFTRAGHAMTSCGLQSNYSFMAARRASCVTSCQGDTLLNWFWNWNL